LKKNNRTERIRIATGKNPDKRRLLLDITRLPYAYALDLARPEKKKARAYIVRAITYKLRNPKYMELYSRNPPTMAPNRFEDRAAGTSLCWSNSLEKASPEKKRGAVSNAVSMILSRPRGKNVRLAPEMNMPAIRKQASKP
jgi:hypothetical protein